MFFSPTLVSCVSSSRWWWVDRPLKLQQVGRIKGLYKGVWRQETDSTFSMSQTKASSRAGCTLNCIRLHSAIWKDNTSVSLFFQFNCSFTLRFEWFIQPIQLFYTSFSFSIVLKFLMSSQMFGLFALNCNFPPFYHIRENKSVRACVREWARSRAFVQGSIDSVYVDWLRSAHLSSLVSAHMRLSVKFTCAA